MQADQGPSPPFAGEGVKRACETSYIYQTAGQKDEEGGFSRAVLAFFMCVHSINSAPFPSVSFVLT